MGNDRRKNKAEMGEFRGTEKHMKRGLLAYRKRSYQRAIKHFKLIIQNDKEYVRAYNNLGYVYQSIDENEKALAIWKSGLKIDPSYARLKKNISNLQRLMKSKRAGSATIEREDFVADVKWLSDDSELLGIREGRFQDVYLLKDGGKSYGFKTFRNLPVDKCELQKLFEDTYGDWLRLGNYKYIVQATSTEWVKGNPFLVMDYSHEGSLRTYFNRLSSLAVSEEAIEESWSHSSLTQIIELALQICIGIEFIHKSIGVPHGDIRLENLMLFQEEGGMDDAESVLSSAHHFVRLTDIGAWDFFQNKVLFCDSDGNVLSEFADEGLVRTPTGFMTTSLSHCAPELLESSCVPTIATDVYAFGVVLYEMLTGMLPFGGSRPEKMLEQIKETLPEKPSTINKKIMPTISDLCMRCLEREPEARFGNFSEMARIMLEYLSAVGWALPAMSTLCKRYKKISRFQFRDEQNNESVMIVGGMEFSSETDQRWEIVKREANRTGDSDLQSQIAEIETLLLPPGLSMGDMYPALTDLTAFLPRIAPETYLREISSLSSKENDTEKILAPIERDKAEDFDDAQGSGTELSGPKTAQKYESFLEGGERDKAVVLLVEEMSSRVKDLFFESPNRVELLNAYEELKRTESFGYRIESILEELSSVSACPGPLIFLENTEDTPAGTMAALTGLFFMLDNKFAPALETFNLIPEEQYLPALGIYLWTMTEFQEKESEEIRLSNLREAASFLKECIIANKRLGDQSTFFVSSNPGATLSATFFLHGLVLEQLNEHRQAIANLRECRRVRQHDEPGLARDLRVWVNIFQGKCMYDLKMPDEAFLRWRRIIMHELRPPFLAFLELGRSKPTTLLANRILQCCEDALKGITKNPLLWSMKGKLLNCVGRNEDAIECSARAIATDENYAPAHLVKAEALLSMQLCEDALDTLRVCLRCNARNPLLSLKEAEILCGLGEADEALLSLRSALDKGLESSDLDSSIKTKRLSALERHPDFENIAGYRN